MYAIPLNALIKKTRLRSRACTSRRPCMMSLPRASSPEMSTRIRGNRSIGVDDLHCDFAMRAADNASVVPGGPVHRNL